MSCTPAHVAAVRGKFETQQKFDWRDLVRKVKKLYLERKYKLCAALCEELISGNPRIHPLYKTFFHFHRAICYESLGIAAHHFSSNKIPFFENAVEAFTSALEALPLPFATGDNGTYNTPRTSPLIADFESVYSPTETDVETSTADTPTPTARPFLPREESYISLTCSDSDSDGSDTITIPDFNDYSPRISFQPAPITPSAAQPATAFQTPNQGLRSKADHKTRLSQSLSHDHVVDHALVPTPLFTRKPKVAVVNTLPPVPVPRAAQCQTMATLSSRPLPPLPFNHNSALTRQGHRIHQPQQRKTALSFNPLLNTAPMPPRSTSSPITPRFDLIRATFTPAPAEHADLKTYLVSVPLARYNEQLAAFGKQVLAHVDSVERRIGDVERGWEEHRAGHGGKSVRFEVGLGMGRGGGRGCGRSSGGVRSSAPGCRRGIGRVASYWSFQMPEREGADEGTKQEKAERISSLKSQGWPVQKERYGWKGSEYYEGLRAKVEAELELEGREVGVVG